MAQRRMTRLIILAAIATALVAQSKQTYFPPVRGTREMVGAANNFEVEAGFRILLQGGNAVDAGVASVLAAAVTEQSRFGLGGEIPILIKLAGKPVIVVNGVGGAPAKATVDFYRNRKPEPWETADRMPPIPTQGILAATVPGAFDALILVLAQFGTMTFEQVSAPAIEYADGFPIGDEFSLFIGLSQPAFALWPASRSFFMPAGKPPAAGEMFREPALAKTLRELVQAEKKARGKRAARLKAVRDLFYQGSLARRMAAFSESHG